MGWNPLESIKATLGLGKKAESSPSTPEGFQELSKQGMLGTFLRHWKNPAFKGQMQAITARMQAEGINLKDRKAVETWIKAHQKEIESGKLDEGAVQTVETVKKSGPDVGRNDPCPCGSGKKFKKCCYGKSAA